MGWSSAGLFFDPVAQALIDAKAAREVKLAALVPLIKGLKEGDWDTTDESLELFQGDPDTVEAFRQAGVVSHGEQELASYLYQTTGLARVSAEKVAQTLYPIVQEHVERFQEEASREK